ncbi:MAG TPA: sulfatase-like hydrolase/transferase [Pirellulales bacterium]|jgi:arylsulfatase A|nr:sulfatase-like hydrolase/transferase [Pirellulales bacterium]
MLSPKMPSCRPRILTSAGVAATVAIRILIAGRSRKSLLVAMLSMLAAGLLPWPVSAADRSRPNILVVVADDLGYGDLGCYGHPVILTPNLDRLAAEGLRLTSCYSAGASCSPSRTGLLTGRTPTRVGVQEAIPMLSPMHLRREEVTIAKLLGEHGYATCMAGKWHLNGMFNLPGQPQPSDHGFGHWFATQNNALPNHHDPYSFVRNRIPVGPQQGYASAIVSREAAHWLRALRDPAKPFFLYVAFHEPHEPIATAERFSRMYAAGDDPSRAAYYGNVSQMDDAFGQLMATLDTLQLRESTLVVFTSDNGPARTRWHNAGSAGPLREHKGHLYEGGIRVPGIVRWPQHVRPGTTSDEPVCGVDLLPTLCQVAGVPLPADRALDGASIVPLFSGQAIERATPLYWHYNLAISAPKVAMRVGDWKILARLDVPDLRHGGDIVAEMQTAIKTASLASFELYNLRQDIGESHDLAAAEPRRVEELAKQMRAIYRQVCAEAPVWPAWKNVRYEDDRIEWPDYRARPLAARQR